MRSTWTFAFAPAGIGVCCPATCTATVETERPRSASENGTDATIAPTPLARTPLTPRSVRVTRERVSVVGASTRSAEVREAPSRSESRPTRADACRVRTSAAPPIRRVGWRAPATTARLPGLPSETSITRSSASAGILADSRSQAAWETTSIVTGWAP